MNAEKDISEEQLFEQVKEVVRKWNEGEIRTARQAQDYIAKQLGTDRRSLDGLGAPVMEIDPTLYYTGAHIAADADGTPRPEVWHDPTWQRLMKEDCPAVFVDAGGTKDIHVGNTASINSSTTQFTGPTGRDVKFHKSYG